MKTYALVSDVTPNCGTVEAISADVGELIDLCVDDTWRAIRVTRDASVGDRIAIDWDAEQINLSECI